MVENRRHAGDVCEGGVVMPVIFKAETRAQKGGRRVWCSSACLNVEEKEKRERIQKTSGVREIHKWRGYNEML